MHARFDDCINAAAVRQRAAAARLLVLRTASEAPGLQQICLQLCVSNHQPDLLLHQRDGVQL